MIRSVSSNPIRPRTPGKFPAITVVLWHAPWWKGWHLDSW